MALNMGGLGFVISANDESKKTRRGLSAWVKGIGSQMEEAAEKSSLFTERNKKGLREVAEFAQEYTRTQTDMTKGLDKSAEAAGRSTEKSDLLGKALTKAGEAGKTALGLVGSGAKAALEGVTALTKGALEAGASIASSLGRTAAGAFTSLRGAMGQARNAMSTLVQGGGQLTTPFENQMQQMDARAHSIGANMGLLGRDLNRFSGQVVGMAYGMGISEEQAGHAVIGFRNATEEFRAMGLTSASMAARLEAAIGVNVANLAAQSRNMTQEFGLSAEQIQRVTSSAIEYGRATQDVSGALNQMPEILTMVRQQASLAGRAMNAEDLTRYAQSINATASAFYSFNHDAEASRTAAMGVTRALLQNQDQMQQLMAGGRSEISDMFRELPQALGGVNQAFDLMNEGPAGFMQGLRQIVQTAEQSGGAGERAMGLLRTHLQTIFGDSTDTMMQFVRGSSESAMEAMNTAMTSTANLGQIARDGFRSTITLEEQYNRLRTSVTQSFRAIGRSATVDFMQNVQTAAEQVTGTMRGLVERGGPLGAVVTTLSEMSSVGIAAVLPPQLVVLQQGMGQVQEALGGVTSFLSTFGLSLGSLLTPIGLVAAGLLVIGGLFVATFLETGGDVNRTIDLMEERIATFSEKAVEFIGRIPEYIARYAPVVLSAVVRLFSAVGRALSPFGDMIASVILKTDWAKVGAQLHSALWAGLARVAGGASGALTLVTRWALWIAKALGEVDWGGAASRLINGFLGPALAFAVEASNRLWAYIVPVLGQLFHSALRIVRGLIPAVVEALGPMGSLIVTYFTNTLGHLTDLAGDILSDTLGMLTDLLGDDSVWDGLLDGAQGILEDIIGAFGRLLPHIASTLARVSEGLPGFVQALGDRVIDIATQLPARLSDLMRLAGSMLAAELPGITASLMDVVWNAVSSLPGLLGRAMDAIPEIMARVRVMVMGALGMLQTAILGVLQGLQTWLIGRFPQYANFIRGVFDGLRLFISGFFTTVRVVAGTALAWVQGAFTILWTVVRGVAEGIWTALSWTFEQLVALGTRVGEGLAIAWLAVSDGATRAFEWVADVAGRAWTWISANVIQPLASAFSPVTTAIQESFGGVFTWVETQFGALLSGVIGAYNRVRGWLGMDAAGTPPPTQAPGARPPGPPTPVPAAPRPATSGAPVPAPAVRAPTPTPGATPAPSGGLLGGLLGGGASTPRVNFASGAQRPARATAAEVGAELQTTMRTVTVSFSEAMTTSLRGAFTTVYAEALRAFDRQFAPRLQDGMARLVTTMMTTFRTLLMQMIAATDIAFGYLNDEAERLATFEARYSAALTTQQALAGTATGTVAVMNVQQRLGHTATNDDLYESINRPDWYDGPDGFARLFTTKMDALTAAVRSSPARQRGEAQTREQVEARVLAATGGRNRAGTPAGS